jgi:hypothetical protein
VVAQGYLLRVHGRDEGLRAAWRTALRPAIA